MNIVIIGPPGSGKGTQAKLLVERLDAHYFQSGEILRRKAKEKTPLGRKIDRLINQAGQLVSDQLMAEIVNDWLDRVGVEKGIVFDGYPRQISQYQTLTKILASRGTEIDKVIYLKVSQKTAGQRLAARRVCPRCGRGYNLLTRPPKEDQLCDCCQVELIQRQDDTPSVIKTRLETYHRLTQPLVAFLRQRGILIEIDGERSIEAIHQEIMKQIEKDEPNQN